MNTTVSITGIHCQACVNLITDITLEQPGVTGVRVDVASKRVSIEHSDAFNAASWKKEIESLNPDYIVQPAP